MMLAKSTWASHWSCLKSVTVDWDLCAGVVRIALLKTAAIANYTRSSSHSLPIWPFWLSRTGLFPTNQRGSLAPSFHQIFFFFFFLLHTFFQVSWLRLTSESHQERFRPENQSSNSLDPVERDSEGGQARLSLLHTDSFAHGTALHLKFREI